MTFVERSWFSAARCWLNRQLVLLDDYRVSRTSEPIEPRPTYPQHLRGTSIELARGAYYIPGPWNVLWEARVIGRGQEAFRTARDRILTWQMHRAAGIRVQSDGDAAVGRIAKLSIGIGPFLIPASCEVVAVVEGEQEAGFSYGTLEGHPERGEQAFLVMLRPDGMVVGSVASFSRPAPLVTVGSAVLQRVQRIVAKRYVAAMLP